MGRPTWDKYFLDMAEFVSKRSTCLSRSVGCVLVRDKQVLSTGYNGPIPGVLHCEERGGCVRRLNGIPSGQRMEMCHAVHAEQNALAFAAKAGVSVQGATCYCTCQPCYTCVKMLMSAGIVRFVYRGSYPDENTLKLLEEAGFVDPRREGKREGETVAEAVRRVLFHAPWNYLREVWSSGLHRVLQWKILRHRDEGGGKPADPSAEAGDGEHQ